MSWLEERHRRKILRHAFPEAWEAVLEQNVKHWRFLDADERTQLKRLVQVFVAEKHWEGCGGLKLTDEIRVTISALACLLVLGLDHVLYRNVQSILVYPSVVVATGQYDALSFGLAVERPPVPILGQAMLDGPVLVVWDAVRRDALHPEKGHNVVYHEFAHKLDMLDGSIDGTPPLADRRQYKHWVAVCTAEYEKLKRLAEAGQRTFLDSYGATSPGEFFAVVTEYFFGRPLEFKRRHEQLYAVLRDFYRQDPATRQARRVSKSSPPASPK